ncbi:MAG: matrixin family metalloprotease [Anaeromyxobacteraceae bacterium]
MTFATWIAVAALAAGAADPPSIPRMPASEGTCQHWPDPTGAAGRRIPWVLADPAGTPACRSGGDRVLAVRRSFETWSAASTPGTSIRCTDVDLAYEGLSTLFATGNDGVNRVVIRRGPCTGEHAVVPDGDPCRAEGTCADRYDCWEHDHLLAVTTTTYRVSTGELLDADIEVDAATITDDDRGFVFTCVDPPAPTCSASVTSGCIAMDLQNTVTHEVGHFLGFAHSEERASTMYARASAGETRKRRLSADAAQSTCSVYPAGVPGYPCSTAPDGCSTAGGSPALAAAASLLLLLRRRRRSA